MRNMCKRFEGRVTDLRANLFTWARIKLGALYLLTITAIILSYSLVMYAAFRDQLHEVSRRKGAEERSWYDRSIDQASRWIFVVDVGVILISAGVSYGLAGYTLKPIRKALEAQEIFTADAAHELRTPIAVMYLNTELALKYHELPTDIHKLLSTNLEELHSTSKMVNQLLTLSRGARIERSAFKLVDMTSLVKSTVQIFDSIAFNKGVSLSVTDFQKVVIYGDEDLLKRLIKNLLANAITYTPGGGSVYVALTSEESMTCLTIIDTGIGIPEQSIPHLFERFYKVDESRTDDGSGLGLAIVKQIVDIHRGELSITSILGSGTTVRVIMPCA